VFHRTSPVLPLAHKIELHSIISALNILSIQQDSGYESQYWRQYWGYIFLGGIFPSKMGRFAPFLATIQALSKTCGFLLGQKYSRMLCMVHTFTGARTGYFIIALNMWFVSWESTPARVKASKRGAKSYPRGKYF
jgi:hypothetical protein